jgi:hypothetical protein
LVLLFTAGYSWATTVADLCTGDPCLVTTTKTVAPGTLDFGGRVLELSGNGKITVSPPGDLTLTAQELHLGPGRTILDKGGSVTVTTTEAIQLDTGSLIDTTATIDAASARITLHAVTDLVLDGNLDASGTGLDASGGTIAADGVNITVNGSVAARGGSREGEGGSVTLNARTLLRVNGTIDASGGDFNDSSIEIDSDGDVVVSGTGKLDVHATGGSGFGGTVAVTATGTIDVHGPISASGASADGSGGDGGEVDLVAGDQVIVAAAITSSGAVPDGTGGNVDIEAGTDVVQTALIDAKGNGTDGGGSDSFSMFAGRDITAGPIDVSGGSFGGGSVDIEAVGSVTVTGAVNADALNDAGPNAAGEGGDITIAADVVTLNAAANVHADGDFVGGNVNIQGCAVTAAAGSNISSGGDLGGNLIQAAGQMTLGGSVVAGPSQGTNTLEYRDSSKHPVLGGSIVPAPTTTLNPLLLPCGAIVTTTTSTTTTTTTSSSTTTIPGVTTTSLPRVTTTSVPGATVTTTTIVAGLSPCTPRDCDDNDPCTIDACVLAGGTCTHEPFAGVKAVTCHLDALEGLIAAAPKPVRRLRPKILTAQRLLNSKTQRLLDSTQKTQTKAGGRLLARAGKQIAAFIEGIEKGQASHKIDPVVAGPMLDLARGAEADLTPLRTGVR